jgi:hypothetical protein
MAAHCGRDTCNMLDPHPRRHADIWPLPHRSWMRRTSRRIAGWLGYLLLFAILVAGQSAGPGTDAPRASLKKRVRRLREGGSDSIQARVIGRSAWCPALPDENVIQLKWRSAVSTLGRDRTIPLADLDPIAIHAPRTKPGQENLPRRYWILDLDGAGGAGSIAATIEELALLGAAAGWRTPPGLQELTTRR